MQVSLSTGLLALAILNKDDQTSTVDRSGVVGLHPQLLKPQYNFEPTQEQCGALNLSMKTAPSERFTHLFAQLRPNSTCSISCGFVAQLEMWADAQRDGHPAKRR